MLLPVLLGSCATMFKGKSGNGVYITANVPEARVFDAKNRMLGTTPLMYKPSASTDPMVTIEKDGYLSQSVIIVKEEDKLYAFLDAMLLCIPCIVDYANGSIYQYNQDTVKVQLRRNYPKDVERLTLFMNQTQWEVSDGSIVGYDQKEPLFFRKSSYDSYLYRSEICAGAKESRYLVANCTVEEENSIALHANTIEIAPVINKIRSNKKKTNGEIATAIVVEVTWKFSKRNGQVVKEIRESYSETRINVDIKPLLARILKNGLAKIMDTDEVYDLLIKENKTNSGSISRYEPIAIKYVKAPAYNRNKDLVQYLMKGVVTIKHDEGHGSGFLISEDGYLITNYHVIKNKKTVNVQFSESLTLTADVIRGDDRYDVALLKINGQGFTALEILNSDSAQAGEDVFAIGTPEDISLGQSVTKGIISGKRKIAEKVYLQTDVAINSGNSGGPLLNEDGKVIGMVTMKLRGNDVEGIGFCVPSNTIFEVLNIQYK